MSFLKVGEASEDTDAKSRKADEANAILNSAAAIRTLKDVEVRNVCGSTAGAGSGTFHKYTQCKRRERFRLEKLNREAKIVQANERLRKRKREQDDLIEMQRNKRRKMRQKKKNRKKMHKKACATAQSENGGTVDDTANDNTMNGDTVETVSSTMGSSKEIQSELAELMAIDESLSNNAASTVTTAANGSDNDNTSNIETNANVPPNGDTVTNTNATIETDKKEWNGDATTQRKKSENEDTTDDTVSGNDGNMNGITLKYSGTAQNKNAAPLQLTKEELIAQALKAELADLF